MTFVSVTGITANLTPDGFTQDLLWWTAAGAYLLYIATSALGLACGWWDD
jgi:threonine/homoserine/homoserine lactone efflux protein